MNPIVLGWQRVWGTQTAFASLTGRATATI